MVEHLKELYRLSLTPDSQILQSATEQLINLYQNPESIFLVITLLSQNEEFNTRKAAAIGLKMALMNCWDGIRLNQEHIQVLENNFIQLLLTETDFTIRHLLIDSIAPVFTTECGNWLQLIQFLNNLSNSTDESNNELFLSVVSAAIVYLPLETVALLFECICTKGTLAIQSQSMPLIVSGSHMLSSMLTLISTAPEIISSLFQEMFKSFYSLLQQNNSRVASAVLNDICTIIRKADQFFEVKDVVAQIFTIISDGQISFENRCIVTELLCTLIDQYPNNIDEAEPQHIISICLELASHLVIDDCFETQQDVMFAIRPIEYLSQYTNPSEFFANFWTCALIDAPEKIVATATALSSFIEYLPEIISMNFSDTFDFALNCIRSPNHCVAEAGLSIVFQLISRHYLLLADLFGNLITAVLPIIQNGDHEPLIVAALTSIIELLFLIDIDDTFLETLFASFLSLVNKISTTNRHLIINGFAALISSSGESIELFAENLIPILHQAASVNVNEQPLVVAAAVEALSCLVKYVPNATSSVHQFTFEKIHMCLQFEDAALFSSCMIALKDLSTTNIFIINPEIVFGSIRKILQFDLESLGVESSVYSAFVEAKATALSLITSLVRFKPEIVAPIVSEFVHLVVNHMELIDDYMIQKAALKASLSICNALKQEANPPQQAFIVLVRKIKDHLLANFDSPNSQTVSLSFKGFARFVTHLHIDLKEMECLQGIVETAIFALKMKLCCQQQEEAINIELSDEVFGFLAVLAQFNQNDFPFQIFFEFTQKLIQQYQQNKLENDRINVLIECIGILVEYYAVSFKSIPSLFKVTLRQWFFESLKLCTMEYPPHPLSAVRCFIESENNVKADELQSIISITNEILSTEFSGQTYYWLTIANAISVLLSTVRILGLEAFGNGIAEIMPKILSYLPKCLNETESENILASLVLLCSNQQGSNANFLIAHFGNDVIRIFSQVVSMKSEKIANLNISEQTLNGVVNMVKQIKGSVPQAEEMISGLLDKFALNRFQKRI